jgi:hypothetical protein
MLLLILISIFFYETFIFIIKIIITNFYICISGVLFKLNNSAISEKYILKIIIIIFFFVN